MSEPSLTSLMPAGPLVNTKTGRFHPIVFRPAPFPGGADANLVLRYRSFGHHTGGFDTAEAAQAHVLKRGLRWIDKTWAWDGEGVPAMTYLEPVDQQRREDG